MSKDKDVPVLATAPRTRDTLGPGAWCCPQRAGLMAAPAQGQSGGSEQRR